MNRPDVALQQGEQMVVMARILGAFGIKGWVKLHVFTENADSLEAFPTWFVSDAAGWREVKVAEFAVNAKGVVARLEGCVDRNAAERLLKLDIAVPRSWLTEPDQGEVYWVDLLGSSVVNRAGETLGQVHSLMETGANDVLVVRDGTREHLIPFVADVVLEVDREAKRVTVEWQQDY